MSADNNADSKNMGFEDKAQELIHLVFLRCEKRLAANSVRHSPEHLALAASALALQKAIAAFLAVEKLC